MQHASIVILRIGEGESQPRGGWGRGVGTGVGDAFLRRRRLASQQQLDLREPRSHVAVLIPRPHVSYFTPAHTDSPLHAAS